MSKLRSFGVEHLYFDHLFHWIHVEHDAGEVEVSIFPSPHANNSEVHFKNVVIHRTVRPMNFKHELHVIYGAVLG